MSTEEQEDILVEDPEPVEAGFEREEVLHNLKADLNFLTGVCTPEIFKYFFPQILLAVWDLITTAVQKPRGILQLALGLPRGFAKTFLLKIFCVYTILFTDRNFILVVCNTEALALNFISDVCDILSSPNIITLFGDWRIKIEKDTQALKKFPFRGRDIILAGIGVGTSMRGLNLKFRRPDVIIMDDMQSREDAEAPGIGSKQLIWMMGTLMKARNYERCLFVFLGNMYPFEDCILRKLKYNKKWISFICGAILEDGTSLWEDFRPLNELLDELENDTALGHPEIFYAEVLNDEEAGTVSGMDTSKIPAYPLSLETVEPQGGFIIIDPSAAKKTSDALAIGRFLLYDGTPVFEKLKVGRFDPFQTIQHAVVMAVERGIKCIICEDVAYQATFLFWFDFVCRQLNITGLMCLPINPGGYAKNARIKDMFKMLIPAKERTETGTILKLILHPSVRPFVINQIVHWNPLRKNNVDDILDICAYVEKAMQMYGEYMELFGNEVYRDLLHPEVAALTDQSIEDQLSEIGC